MKATVRAWLRRLGVPGILGIGLLLGCVAFWVSALQPLHTEIRLRQAALAGLQAGSPYRPAAAQRHAEDLRRFYSLFPSATDIAEELQRLHGIGRAAGVELTQGEYRLERRSPRLLAYRVILPVRGTYAQVRDFLDGVLKHLPVASIDAVRFERKSASDTELEAQLRITLHLRPSGERQ